MKYVLVCEDESSIREFVVINLKRSGYEVVEAASGEEALEKFDKNKIDVALLDIMLPGIDGFEVCRELRKQSPTLGIIMLTAKSQEMEKVGGLMMGADDYVTKPFSPSELTARVDALCRRVSSLKKKEEEETSYVDELVDGRFVLNLRNRSLEKDHEPIELTQVEFQIMEYFFINANKPVSRTAILDRVWGDEFFGEEKIVDVNIRRLRMKIEDDPSHPEFIVTVWGHGYKWVTEK